MNTEILKSIRPEVLVLEDNREILEQLKRMAKRADFEFKGVRSVDEAVNFARLANGKIGAVLVDMMVPLSENDVLALDLLILKRDELLGELIPADGQEPQKDAQVLVGKKLDEVDAKINHLVRINGGITFLEQAKQYLPPNRIVILTTRDIGDKSLKEDVSKIGGSLQPLLRSKIGMLPELRRQLTQWRSAVIPASATL